MTDNYLIPVIPFHEQIISRGEGSYIYDNKGRRYLDLNSGQFCAILGHSNHEFAEKISEIAGNLVHTSSGMLSEAVLKTAKKMNKISGEMDARSIFLSTGAEAVEFAIRYAKHITGKNGLVCFDKGYHGLTLGTQSITFGGKYACPDVRGVISTPVPSDLDEQDCIINIEKQISENKDLLAAVVMEPIVSVGGMLYPGSDYFKAVRELCNKNDVLLIFDESQTGFGRTGAWFCYQDMHVIPDMVICSKGIGMGYPVSAVLFHGRLMSKTISMTHYSSHQNDPFAAGIVEFGIDYIEKKDLLHANKKNGQLFLSKLTALLNEKNFYRNPRGRGMMLGLDLYIPDVDNYRPVYANLYHQAAEFGVLLQGTDGGRVLRFLPDYLITEQDMDLCIDALKRVKL